MLNTDIMEKRTLQVLKFVKNKEGCQAQDVQEHLGLSRPLIASILRSLEELGLIKRDFGEGRALSLKITEKGKKVLVGEKMKSAFETVSIEGNKAVHGNEVSEEISSNNVKDVVNTVKRFLES